MRTESLNQHVIGTQTAFQGALYDLGLLMDFLEHKVAVLALVGGFRTFVVLHALAYHRLAGYIPDLHAVALDFGDIAFFQVHKAVGDLAQGQLVGGEEVFAQAQADHQRAAAASSEQAIWLLGADHRQAVGTVQFLDRLFQCCGQVRLSFQLVVEQVHNHFGVGIGAEHVTQPLELGTQFFVVLDDAVVHHCQIMAREVWVGIALAWRTVGGPAGVRDAQATGQRLGT